MRWSRTERARMFPGLEHTKPFKSALTEVAHVLRQNASALPGARVEMPGSDAREPEFYVVTLRVSGDEQDTSRDEHRRPMALFHLLSPDWFAKNPVGQLIYVAAMGYYASSISVRRFLRSWQELQVGGEVIYEGDLTDPSLGERALEGLQRFLVYRDEISVNRDIGTISIWPLTTDFRPRLCGICLLPAAQGICPKCGIPSYPGNSKRRFAR